MTAAPRRPGFAARPDAGDRWVAADAAPPVAPPPAFTARLTLDVTPTTRRRLKLAAVAHGTTVADLLRTLIDREFPEGSGESE